MISNLRLLFVCLSAFAASGMIWAQSVEQLASTPERWPAEVTVTATARAVIMEKGQPTGAMLVGSGRQLMVTAISTEGVTGKLGGTTVRLPADKTDLWQRVGAAATAPAAAAVTAANPVSPPPTATAQRAEPAAPTPYETMLTGKLVGLSGGKVAPFDGARLKGVKFYGLYFSASWCGPCRHFTPELIKAYAALKKAHPEFEVIFVSWDRSESDMHAYLRDDRMPWPALRFSDRKLGALTKHAGDGIPSLVLVDASGKELSNSFRGGKYVGPGVVLDDTWRILKQARSRSGAQ